MESNLNKDDITSSNQPLYQKFFELSLCLFLIADKDGTIIKLNRSWESALGYSINEMEGKDYLSFVHPDDIDRTTKTASFLLEEIDIESFSTRFLCKDGSSKLIEWRAYPDGEFVYISAHEVNSISLKENSPADLSGSTVPTDLENYLEKLKLAEKKWKESESRFHYLLENVQYISVQGYRADGTIVYWNKASEQVYGFTAEEAMGKNLVDLIIPPPARDFVREAVKIMVETGIANPPDELWLLHKNGELIPVFSNHTIVDIPGKGKELFCIDIDISERVKAQTELLKAKEKAEELSRLKSTLIANLSHEIKTPLMGIMGFAEVLETSLQSDEELELVHRIVGSVQRLNETFTNLLNLVEFETDEINLRRNKFMVGAYVGSVVQNFHESASLKGLKLEFLPCEKEFDVELDKHFLGKILNNLIGNSIKFTNHGYVKVSVKMKIRMEKTFSPLLWKIPVLECLMTKKI
ncbi:MAG: PAS domain-containing sensor histidine kinase [Ignavibacteriales bacterium]|nr:PAS domain-containing sensor histidine kinase [Ignavibacteriales bacterium]